MILKKINKVIINPARVIQRVKDNLYRLVGDEDYIPFIVLSRSRTGSTLLQSLLDSHSRISMDEEVFRTLKGRSYKKILHKVFGKQPSYLQAKGFKLFYYHPTDDSSNRVWEELKKNKKLKIIHLKRRNILRTLTSRKLAEKTGQWQGVKRNDTGTAMNKKITFTVEELERYFVQTQEWQRKGDKVFEDQEVLDVYYVDLINDQNDCMRKVFDFLGCNFEEVNTNLQKQNPEPLSDIISNYELLKERFSGTEWESFFSEEEPSVT